jgi:hypothetical protein
MEEGKREGRPETRPLKSAVIVSRNLLGWKITRGKDIAGACSSSRLPLEYQFAMYRHLFRYCGNYVFRT